MNEWIDVRERLPREDPRRAHLVVYQNPPKGPKRGKRTVRFAIYSGGAWRFITERDKSRLSERVTHWMPKPRLPKRSARSGDARGVASRLASPAGMGGMTQAPPASERQSVGVVPEHSTISTLSTFNTVKP